MRSRWKGLFIHTILYKFIKSQKSEFGRSWLNQKINIRSSCLVNRLKKKALYIYDGSTLLRIKIFVPKPENIKLGQFTYNRIFPRHSLRTEERRITKRLLDVHKGLEKSKKKRRAVWKRFKASF
jgi:ribosomal protein S19